MELQGGKILVVCVLLGLLSTLTSFACDWSLIQEEKLRTPAFCEVQAFELFLGTPYALGEIVVTATLYVMGESVRNYTHMLHMFGLVATLFLSSFIGLGCEYLYRTDS